jgi:hypothetical protein
MATMGSPLLQTMRLRLFLDSADVKAWEEWLPSGLFHGITCNPTLLRRAGQPCRLDTLAALTRRALELGAGELHLQAWGADAQAYAACGRELAALAPGQVLVKLPITRFGALAARELIALGMPVTLTAAYEPHQALVATALGLALVAYRGWPVLAIGVASMVAALAYMGGPRPIAYTPFGELTVFVFFGLVAVMGTDWVLTGTVGTVSVLAAVAMGGLAAAALAVNNHRDLAHDRPDEVDAIKA